MQVTYHGWSGLSFRHQDTWLGFDPTEVPPPNAGPGRVVVCVSHGHPDHFQGVRGLSTSSDGQLLARTHVVSTPPVVRKLAGGRTRHLHALRPGESTTVDGVGIEGFWWDHMSLLPPERKLRAHYVRRFVSHPLQLVRVAAAGIGSPINAPMLGFAVTLPDGTRILNYGEGLHRMTDLEEVAAIANKHKPDVFCFAVEPEDVDEIPNWIEIVGAPTVVIFEPHRPWRDAFSLPHVDLDRLGAKLRELLPDVRIITLSDAGTVVDLGEEVVRE